MYILGISAYYHDSAAALLKDGKVVAAVEEERFTRKKHDNSFPENAVGYCLKESGIGIDDIDRIAYYEKPLLKFERILNTFTETCPRSLKPFLKSIPDWVNRKIKVEKNIRKKLNYESEIYFIPHHLSHASSTYYSSGFKESAIATIDGVGEYQTTGLCKGSKEKIKPIKSINFPNSLGLLYSTFTAFLGFMVNNDEYKVMGLSAYGKPKFKKEIYKIINVKKDGSFELDMNYFSFRESFQMWNKKFEEIFGKPRDPDKKITQRYKDIAASIQKVTEEIYIKILNHLYKITKSNNLCLSGGVALNVLANGLIHRETPFKKVYVFGPAGDGGTALGAACFAHSQIIEGDRIKNIKNLNLGPSYSNKQIKRVLDKNNLSYKNLKNNDLIDRVSNLLKNGQIIGWFQGGMEYGPRALGQRSIIARPEPYSMRKKVNKIKKREQFRPFAGSFLEKHVNKYLEIPESQAEFPFMTFAFPVKNKDEISAIVHENNTSRVQTVSQENEIYYDLIKNFYEKTGIPCVLNTSFNVKGEPIVENPQQAVEDFLKTDMDYLAIGNYLVNKN